MRRGKTLDISLLSDVVSSGYKYHINKSYIASILIAITSPSIIIVVHFQKAAGSSNWCLRLQTAPQCTTLVLSIALKAIIYHFSKPIISKGAQRKIYLKHRHDSAGNFRCPIQFQFCLVSLVFKVNVKRLR